VNTFRDMAPNTYPRAGPMTAIALNTPAVQYSQAYWSLHGFANNTP